MWCDLWYDSKFKMHVMARIGDPVFRVGEAFLASSTIECPRGVCNRLVGTTDMLQLDMRSTCDYNFEELPVLLSSRSWTEP